MLRKQNISEFAGGKQKKRKGKKDKYFIYREGNAENDLDDAVEASSADGDGMWADKDSTPLFSEPSKMDKAREAASNMSGAVSSFCGSLFKSGKKTQPYSVLNNNGLEFSEDTDSGIDSFPENTTDADSGQEEKGGCFPWLRRRR